MKQITMSNAAHKNLMGMLDQLNGFFSNSSCNDFELPNTPENMEFMENAIKCIFKGKDVQEQLEYLGDPESDTIMTLDVFALDYLIHIVAGAENIREHKT